MDPIIAALLGLLIGTFAGTWHPLSFLHKAPPTKELTAAQAKLTEQELQHKQALAEKDAAAIKERAALLAEFGSAYEASSGAEFVLKKVPPEQQTPITKLGTAMIVRGNERLGGILGPLPLETLKQIQEMMNAILDERDEARAQRDKALADLALTDKAFTSLQATHAGTVALLAEKDKQVVAISSSLDKTQATVTSFTEKVKDFADKRAAAEGDSNFWQAATKALAVAGAALLVLALTHAALIHFHLHKMVSAVTQNSNPINK